MATEDLRAYADQNFDSKVETTVEPLIEEYCDNANIPAQLRTYFNADAIAQELHNDAVSDFANEGAQYVKDNSGEVVDGFDAWFDENFDGDYLYQMVERQYGLHESEIEADAKEMLRTDLIDQDEELSQLDDSKVQAAIEQSDTSDVLEALTRGDAHNWADLYLTGWEDEIEE